MEMLFEEAWKEFEQRCIPSYASEGSRLIAKINYYYGALAYIKIAHSLDHAAGLEENAAVLLRLEDEIRHFTRLVEAVVPTGAGN